MLTQQEKSQARVVMATIALGRVRQPHLGFVIRFHRSAIAYYKQVGPAGRALERSDGTLRHGGENKHSPLRITRAFAMSACSGSATQDPLAAEVRLQRARRPVRDDPPVVDRNKMWSA